MYEKFIGYQLVLHNYRWAKALEDQWLIFQAALARNTEAATEQLESHLRKNVSSLLRPINALLHCVFDYATYVKSRKYWRVKWPIPPLKFGHGTPKMAANLAKSTGLLPGQPSRKSSPLASILCS